MQVSRFNEYVNKTVSLDLLKEIAENLIKDREDAHNKLDIKINFCNNFVYNSDKKEIFDEYAITINLIETVNFHYRNYDNNTGVQISFNKTEEHIRLSITGDKDYVDRAYTKYNDLINTAKPTKYIYRRFKLLYALISGTIFGFVITTFISYFGKNIETFEGFNFSFHNLQTVAILQIPDKLCT